LLDKGSGPSNIRCLQLNTSLLENILIKPNNSILGPKIGSKIGKLNNEIQSLNHNELYKELLIHDKIIILDIELTLEALHIEHTNLDNSEFIEDNNFEVSIETKLDNNLIEEGISREIIHNIQNLRKNSGFNISDKISMFYYGDEKIEKVIEKYQTHMSEEILATKIMKCESKRGSNIKFKINNSSISINIELS
jgi:isoleucyl-tRNA synthetase